MIVASEEQVGFNRIRSAKLRIAENYKEKDQSSLLSLLKGEAYCT